MAWIAIGYMPFVGVLLVLAEESSLWVPDIQRIRLNDKLSSIEVLLMIEGRPLIMV